MKFIKKPVVIEAVQWLGYNEVEVSRFAAAAIPGEVQRGREILLETMEGVYIASVGDWIIKGVKGEFYPCKPDIFEMTYRPYMEVDDGTKY